MDYDYGKLRGRIVAMYGGQANFAETFHISERSLSLKLNNIVSFKQPEIQRACDLLDIPMEEMSLWAIKQNPKNGQSDGTLSLKGYGAVGREFVRLMDYCFCELEDLRVVTIRKDEETASGN